MINVLICGIGGKMGGEVFSLLKSEANAQAVCGVDVGGAENYGIPVYADFVAVKEKIDVIIDFSSPAVLEKELGWAVENNVAVVLGTTGYSAEQLAFIDECAKKTAVFRTANFSLGINLLMKLVREAATVLGEKFDIEIVEKHHRLKADAPSGTALMLAESANVSDAEYLYGRNPESGRRGKEIGIHAVRGGTIVGEHEVIFAGEDEIVTLSHSARSKRVFAAGAVKAALFVAGKPAGRYDMKDII